MHRFDRMIEELKPLTNKYPWLMPAILGDFEIGEIYRNCLKERYKQYNNCDYPNCDQQCQAECKKYFDHMVD